MALLRDFNKEFQQERVNDMLERLRMTTRPLSSYMDDGWSTTSSTSSTTIPYIKIQIEDKIAIDNLKDEESFKEKKIYHFDPEEIVND
jgi:hypothetical protein